MGDRQMSIAERLVQWLGIKNSRAEELETQLEKKKEVIDAQDKAITEQNKEVTELRKANDTLQKQVDTYEKEINAINTAIEDDRKKTAGTPAEKPKRSKK